MAYPDDKETFRRVVNQELPAIPGDTVDEDDQNLPASFLERLQDTLGYSIKMGFVSVKAFFDFVVTELSTITGKVSKTGDTMSGDLIIPAPANLQLNRDDISLGNNTIQNTNHAIGIGKDANWNQDYGIGIGKNAHNNNDYGIGIGVGAATNNHKGIGIGFSADHNTYGGIGIGVNAEQNTSEGIGIGEGAEYNTIDGIGIGHGAHHNQNGSIGIGLNATAPTADCIAIGKNCSNAITKTFKIPDDYSFHCAGIPIYANNAAAITGGLTVGAFYRTGADPDPICVVH